MASILRRLLLGGWAIWFAVVTVSNTCNLLRTVGWLSQDWTFSSNNFELISRATGRGPIFNGVLFVGVILWEAAATLTLAWACWRRPASLLPFIIGIGLFLAFMIGDEITLAYGPQGIHIRLLSALSLSLLVTRHDPARV